MLRQVWWQIYQQARSDVTSTACGVDTTKIHEAFNHPPVSSCAFLCMYEGLSERKTHVNLTEQAR